jgi:trans-aconitate methyltransferase
MKGSLLTPYRERLTPQLYERLLAEYTRRLRAGVDDRRPYFLSFKRMLVWARLPAGGRARGANAD